MKITNELIKSFNPCTDRYDNYLKFYANKTHSLDQFMDLEDISHDDKLWVCFRLMPRQNRKFCAADIAELVLPIFEAEYPNDKRPRLAIEAARDETMNGGSASIAAICAVHAGEASVSTCAIYAAYAAAHAAYASVYVSHASAHGAEAATYAAAHGAEAATYAAAVIAAYAVEALQSVTKSTVCSTYTASYVADSNEIILKQIRTIVLKYMK